MLLCPRLASVSFISHRSHMTRGPAHQLWTTGWAPLPSRDSADDLLVLPPSHYFRHFLFCPPLPSCHNSGIHVVHHVVYAVLQLHRQPHLLLPEFSWDGLQKKLEKVSDLLKTGIFQSQQFTD